MISVIFRFPGEPCTENFDNSVSSNDADPSVKHESLDVDSVYSEAMQLIDITDELKSAPEMLSKQCGRLENLRAELKESIDALKKQSCSVPGRTAS